MVSDYSDYLFCGWGESEFGVAWYRTVLPARELDAEYVIFDMTGKGVARKGTRKRHSVIVLQHCWERWQIIRARKMMQGGAKVIINVDDWIPSIGKIPDSHDMADYFGQKSVISEWKTLIREADGVIGATPWLVQRLRSLNPNVELARNGLDLPRYQRYRRDATGPATVIGWAGGTGHTEALARVSGAISEVLRAHKECSLLLVGADLVGLFPADVTDRVKHRAWSDFYSYPLYLSLFDINLAPAMENDFYKAKSQLRFYEACAMGTPTVGHPMYDEIEEAAAGWTSTHHEEWVQLLELAINKPEWLNNLRSRAREYAQTISIQTRIEEWKSALTQLTSK